MGNRGSITKQKIVDESLQLFSVKGYFNTSLNDILDATDLTKGGLYGHFQSKEEIWYATYEQAVKIWKDIVFKDIKSIDDPITRIQTALENDLKNYLGANVFEGGCFFLNMLVELSGQSSSMSTQILRGFIDFSGLIKKWLLEAQEQKCLKPDLNLDEIANFIVTSINGCAALYASIKDPEIIEIQLSQLNLYLNQMRY